MILFSAVTPGKTKRPKHASVSWLLSYTLQSKPFPSLSPPRFIQILATMSWLWHRNLILCPHFSYFSTNNSLESSNKSANICATSALTVTCETVSPEGHGEPHSHHHVGSATILRRENSLKITPHLKEYMEISPENNNIKVTSHQAPLVPVQPWLKLHSP